MEHKWMRLFVNGEWTGREDRKVTLSDGSEHSIDDLAKKHGIELPSKPKKANKINTDIKEKSYGDLGQAHDEGSAEEHGNGDSEGSE